ncbi:MAG: hypothetical protein WC697_03505 [Patescibacteria group bacterium]|jgi:hypothetical protein
MGAKTSQDQAREIMGKNFIGIKEVERLFSVKLSPEQVRMWGNLQLPSKILEDKRDTHLLALNPEFSILKISKMVKEIETEKEKMFFKSKVENLQNQPFILKMEPGWFLLEIEGIKDSNKLIFDEQKKFIKEGENIPSVNQVVYGAMAYYLLTKKRLFQKYYVRTSSKNSDGTPIVAGLFDERGMDIAAYPSHVKLNTVYVISSII